MKKATWVLALSFFVLSATAQRVGIGTTSPVAKLEVQDDTTPELGVFRCSGPYALVNVMSNSTNTALGAIPGRGFVGTQWENDFAIRVSGIDRMIFNQASGFVGIDVQNPGFKLDVYGAPNTTLASFRTHTGWGQIITGTYNVFSDLGASETKGHVGTNTDHDFVIRTGGDDRMFFKHSNGAVGIGTANPQKPLSIRANSSHDLLQFNNYAADAPLWHWWLPSDNLVLTETNVADYRLVIEKGSGNIGIGFDNPSYRLHVNGPAACSELHTGSIATGSITATGGAWTTTLTATTLTATTLNINSIPNEAPAGVSFFNGNFQNQGAPFENVTWYRDKEGRVHLSGVVKIIGSQLGSMFVLPEGARPGGDIVFGAMTSSGNMVRVNITPQGSVTLQTATDGWVSVNGISFRAL